MTKKSHSGNFYNKSMNNSYLQDKWLDECMQRHLAWSPNRPQNYCLYQMRTAQSMFMGCQGHSSGLLDMA